MILNAFVLSFVSERKKRSKKATSCSFHHLPLDVPIALCCKTQYEPLCSWNNVFLCVSGLVLWATCAPEINCFSALVLWASAPEIKMCLCCQCVLMSDCAPEIKHVCMVVLLIVRLCLSRQPFFVHFSPAVVAGKGQSQQSQSSGASVRKWGRFCESLPLVGFAYRCAVVCFAR